MYHSVSNVDRPIVGDVVAAGAEVEHDERVRLGRRGGVGGGGELLALLLQVVALLLE